MSNPAEALPKPVPEESVQALLASKSLPKATEIVSPTVTAEYHGIYFLTLPACDKTHGHSQLVLRVSGHHLPSIKTRNEVAVMSWVAKNTTIPIPYMIAHDNSEDNPIAHEYTLLSKCPGVTLSDIYSSLHDEQMIKIIDQIIDILVQLHAHQWEGIGGLDLNDEGQAVLARIVHENFWQTTDIDRYWTSDETVESLNIGGPYKTYIDYISAQIRQYIHLIKKHSKLGFMVETVPRLEAFITALPKHADELNKVVFRLAHQDIHLANLMFDESSGKITGVLDWEFSGVVPFPCWNPRRAFLWNGRYDDANMDEKKRLMGMFTRRCKERNVSLLDDAEYASLLQESMQDVADYLRAIVEVSPRGQRQNLVQGWKDVVLEGLGKFGV